LVPSNDFGARDFDGSGVRKIHDHTFVGANTAIPWLVPDHETRDDVVAAHAGFLKDRKLRIDLFGLKKGGRIQDTLIAPLRPELPRLEPGATYLVEVVIRTLDVGHHFTQGTADSNEVWVEFLARSGERVIGRSGALIDKDGRVNDKEGRVDEWSHFVNVLMLD